MPVRLIVMLFFIEAYWITTLTHAADEDTESISIEAESHQIERKLTFEKSFAATANQNEYTLLFEKKLEQYGSLNLNS